MHKLCKYVLDNGTGNESFIRKMCLDGHTVDDDSSLIVNLTKCAILHHSDPFLILGPLKLEVIHFRPFRSIMHEFFTQEEIDWMLNYTQPRLSNKRNLPESTKEITRSEKLSSNKRTSVAKAIQTFFPDIKYNETQNYYKLSKNLRELNDDLNDKVSKQHVGNRIYLAGKLRDPYSYHVINEIMFKISKRIEVATRMNLTSRHGSTEYQVTNYGLAGMVEKHLDCWGVETGTHLPWDRRAMVSSGDAFATMMGWIENTKMGGGTYFSSSSHHQLIFPQKQSAAFWIDTLASGVQDRDQEHGACPVLQGSKWILNKWIYHYNQWKNYPCSLQDADYIDFVQIS